MSNAQTYIAKKPIEHGQLVYADDVRPTHWQSFKRWIKRRIDKLCR